MLVIFGLILGAFVGARTAAKRGGTRWDMAQYGAGFAIAFTLVGLVLTIILERSLL